MSRRKFILHYFGEAFDEVNGDGADMDDNARNPKEKEEAQQEVVKLLSAVKQTAEKFKSKEIVKTLVGKVNALISSHKADEKECFGIGKDKDEHYWMALTRQVLVAGLLKKEIEQYGILHITQKGEAFLENPSSFMMTKDHVYSENYDDSIITMGQSGGELLNIHGVGEGKAKKYGKPFITVIQKYVEEHDVVRADDLVVKSTGANSGLKLYIIQNVDRKLSLDDIAAAKGLELQQLIKEMEQIVFSGTKLNISYWIDEILDEDQQEEIHDYFIEAESDSIEDAMEEFDGDYEDEELRLYRLKFISEVAN